MMEHIIDKTYARKFGGQAESTASADSKGAASRKESASERRHTLEPSRATEKKEKKGCKC